MTAATRSAQRRADELTFNDVGKIITFDYHGQPLQGVLCGARAGGSAWLRLLTLEGHEGEFSILCHVPVAVQEVKPLDVIASVKEFRETECVPADVGPVAYTDRLMTIEHRIDSCKDYNFGMVNADRLAHEDARWMLNELRRLRHLAAQALEIVP